MKQNPDGVLLPRHMRVLFDDPSTNAALVDATTERLLIDHLIEEDVLRRSDRGMELTVGDEARNV
jgi:hypothetical protein